MDSRSHGGAQRIGDRPVRSAYFVSDSTGVTAETLGSALLANFPGIRFIRHTVPFVDTVAEAEAVEAAVRRDRAEGLQPLMFATIKRPALRDVLAAADAEFIDLLAGHLTELEQLLGTTASEQLGQFHGTSDSQQYYERMRAVEYAIEHDDGQSRRGLPQADVIIIAPSRCGKTPTTMYLALQYGLRVANYPLTEDDFHREGLPPTIADYRDRCFGLTSTPRRLSQVRHERRPSSRYASIEQCTFELRWAESLYAATGVPFLNSSTKSDEEMTAVIMHTMRLRGKTQ